MLFAKITPTAKIGIQENVFNVVVTEAPYMTAIAQVYKLGQSYTQFEVVFGDFSDQVTDPNQPAPPPFKKMLTQFMEFSAEELSNWGADDSIVLELIAQKLGADIIEVVNKQDIYTL
jgi:hypothetical protein